MKKIILIIITLLLTSCTRSKIIEINYDKLYNKMSSYDNYIVYFCNETENCKKFNKTIKKITKENNLKIYYLNTNKIATNEKTLIESLYFHGENIIEPSIIIVEKGIIKKRQIAITDYETTNKFLK